MMSRMAPMTEKYRMPQMPEQCIMAPMGMPIIDEEMKEEKKEKTGFFGKVAKFFSKDSKNAP